MNLPTDKAKLRSELRAARRAHAAAQPQSIRGLLFHRPPSPLTSKIGNDAVIGLYHANSNEAPAHGYARFFHDAGHVIALPYFPAADAPMEFRRFTDPHADSDLEAGPFGIQQPGSSAAPLLPDILFIPLVGFTADLKRLGQGGGHYDRWLAEHPGRIAIGLAWDVQLADDIPIEPHDITLDGVVTPTRLYGLN